MPIVLKRIYALFKDDQGTVTSLILRQNGHEAKAMKT